MHYDHVITEAELNRALERARMERSQEFHRIIKKIFAAIRAPRLHTPARTHGAAAKFGA